MLAFLIRSATSESSSYEIVYCLDSDAKVINLKKIKFSGIKSRGFTLRIEALIIINQ